MLCSEKIRHVRLCFCVCVVAGGLFYGEASNISRGTERQGFGSSLLIPRWFLYSLVPMRLFCSLIPMFILTFHSCSKIQISSVQNIKRHNLKIRCWIPWHQDTSVGDTGRLYFRDRSGGKDWFGQGNGCEDQTLRAKMAAAKGEI